MKKILFFASIALFAASCTEDYTDWASLQQNPAEEAKTVTMSVTPAAGNVDLAAAGDSVQLFVPAVVISDEATSTYEVVLTTGEEDSPVITLTADNEGRVLTSELQEAVLALYGARPVPRNLNMAIAAYTVVNGQSIKNVAQGVVSVIPEAPEIEQEYYVTGTPNGWDNTNTDYAMTNDGSDPYENPTFTLRIPASADGSNIEFKLTPKSGLGGDWNKCLAYAGEEGKFSYNNQGGNFVIEPVADAVAYKLTFKMLELTYTVEAVFSTPETWYLVGGCIGDGSWGNSSLDNVGVSLFPLARTGNSTISYTGYFTTDGFKLIKTPGSWNDQWGQGANGYVKNDGGSGNITVPSAGYYTVTLDYINDVLTIEAADVTPQTYEVGMAGSFNGWSFQAMNKCAGNDHLWRYELSAAADEEGKFLIDGWSVNWGAADFPTGVGQQNGPNIPIERGSYIVIFNDITGGYNFIRTDAEPEPVVIPDTWYLVGSCIGDGTWSNSGVDNVGVSLFPLAYDGESSITYTGYFTTDGFKLIKTPGSWDDQWGQGANGYVKNDGTSGNITVPAAGYYTVTYNQTTDELTIVPADITPETYAVGIAGSFNEWSFQTITKCAGSDHLWRCEFTADTDTELKFLIDGWAVNWGAAYFPSGIGVNGGANIPVAAGSYVVVFNDITGGYNFVSK